MTKQADNLYFTGIDIGSTTAKAVVLDKEGGMVFSRYCRHQGKTVETTRGIFKEALEELGDVELDLAVTGSAGMGAAEFFGLPFVQEVVASAHYIEKFLPGVRTFIEIGGEDSKIIFFDDNGRPDIRMNGSCAGGTGAFIDQMAVLLGVDVAELNVLAGKATNIYPIASRCGVFAKTDIQALLSRHVSKEDVAASIFHSVALQVITALSRGREMERKILIGGGPLTFYPNLRKAFANLLGIEHPDDLVLPDHPELLPAMGAAMVRNGKPCRGRISNFLSMSERGVSRATNSGTKRLPPLFASNYEFEIWQKRHERNLVPRIDLPEAKGKDLFLGVDSGSTTTKIVLVDEKGKLVLSYYGPNNGDPIQAVKKGLAEFRKKFVSAGFAPRITRTAATGYGESLIRTAFGLDDGLVETMAHYRAARRFEPDVSFILDIGGQDMKAIYIHDNAVAEIQINEACSSGCGSFIETFARSLGYSVQEFAEIACDSKSPFDLGTRCTVFMNSKVKQALREGATVGDISAGLAYSVIKNALYKVLKLKDVDVLGDKIVVQGGTFRNPAVLRALEVLLNKEVMRPDISELMGAYGAALTALANHRAHVVAAVAPQQEALKGPDRPGRETDDLVFEKLVMGSGFSKKEIRCRGCENQCRVLKLTFSNGNHFYTGNRCERRFSNNPDAQRKGRNLIDDQIRLLFERNTEPEGEPIFTYGIPRCLNMYENFPFWCAFLTTCGFRVVLSSESGFKLYEKGSATVMSENICFPAKLAHGHIFDLIGKKVDRIFYPTVVYEQEEYENALNTYNCPVVTGYPDLLKSAVNPERKFGIPLDNPVISFKDFNRLKDQLYLFFKQSGINYRTVSEGVEKGMAAQSDYRKQLRSMAKTLLSKADAGGRTTVVLAGRPYHADPLVNHGIPNLLTELGVDVISETAVPLNADAVSLEDVNVLTQWSYANRLYAAAGWVTDTANAQMVQLSSFGCGPDAVSTDEVKEILRHGGKIHTLIKMDEIVNVGAVRIRLRSMLDAVKEKNGKTNATGTGTMKKNRAVVEEDRKRILIAPYFSPFYSPLIPSAFRPLGYRVEVLPPQDRVSVEWGLKTINNDMCYPAILVAGDIIKAFQSGRYDPENTAVILTQTGGQCRASSYVSLIRKGLAAADLDEVPVIAISNEEIDPQPGFKIDKKGLIKRLGLGIIFADPLARMYLATMVREKVPGTSKNLHEKYLFEMETGIENADYYYLLNLLKRAVADFNRVEINDKTVPRVGIVGEIFVKYNFFSNGNIIDWLSGQGVEVVLPPIQSFFAQRFINETYNQKAFFKRSLADRIKYRLLEIYSRYHIGQIERVMQGFRFYKKAHDLRELAEITDEVVSLANQFGEGWLLTAEMIAMLNEGIGNIVCLQPFGCIANHITGKGMENKLKEMFPSLNLLSLDMDAGASEVNLLNRLHFMVTAAREEVDR
ncbi:acyl-CoA dehydratase activase [Deferribacterales bacterium Es71-Z0220]|uniref:acyl-CoA dehydratase activase n=1 Tax=Deferrivibrio essentukiensis TaxID=2880922 RepID=UPI001F60377C|nr:acyl-CoA dehydratase activase [Deferrivibrio essentukiensis]MCB4203482.1 acyl-CoA dehydratase activase [Deferrivibrio essentukiensis]